MRIAESEKIKKTFAFNVDIFKPEKKWIQPLQKGLQYYKINPVVPYLPLKRATSSTFRTDSIFCTVKTPRQTAACIAPPSDSAMEMYPSG